MTSKELKAKLAQVSQELAALDALDSFTDEQQSEWDAKFAEATQLKADIAAAEEQEKKRAQQRSQLKDFRAAANAPNLEPNPLRRGQPGEPKITRQHNSADDDPNAGFRSHREFHEAIIQAGLGRTDERLLPLKAAAGSDEQSTFSDAYGGYLVPEGFLPGLMTTMAESDPTVRLVQSVPMSSQIVRMNARTDQNHTTSVSGGLVVYRREETGTVSSGRMQIEQIKLEATMLMGVSYASEEILEQSPISFAALLEQGFADEFGAKIIREKISGTGVGQLEGILNTPALITVNKEAAQSADTVLYANIVKMRARLWRYSRAIWLYNHDCLPQLMRMPDDDGRLIWQSSARDGEPDMFLGRPAYASEWCKTVGDVGDIILADWSQYLYGTYGGSSMRSAESPYVRFLEHERCFKYWLSNAGKPWWRAAITPANSTATLSPFVVLQAR